MHQKSQYFSGMELASQTLGDLSPTDVFSSGTIQLFKSDGKLFSDFLSSIDSLLDEGRERLLDMGCGYGGLSRLLALTWGFKQAYGIEIDDGDILDDHLPGLWIIAAMDKKALVFVPEIIAEYAIYPVAFLFDDKFGQVVVVHTGQFHVGTAKPGPGGGLCVQTMCGHQAEYNKDPLHQVIYKGVARR